MGVHSFKAVQRIPSSLQSVWEFFSCPSNLQTITPTTLKFSVISKHVSSPIYAGQIIEYQVKPLLGIPVYWMTEIIHVKEGEFFADEQRKGPYRLWHHQHHFKEIPGGVEMTDIVHYKSPGWILEGLIDRFIVRPKLNTVFKFRYEVVEERFGKWKE
jgi:ligand-binding SRPBCC domain-containing protein